LSFRTAPSWTIIARARARGKIERKPESARETAVAVGEKANLAIGSGAFCPCLHDENIVDAGHRDLIHPLRLELIEVVEKTRQMVFVAQGVKAPATPKGTTLRPLKI
jgi:hypothetical protein